EACFPAAAIVGAEFISRRLRLSRLIGFPVAWVGAEWLRGVFPVGFPWNPLGAALYRSFHILQLAELAGVYGLSALVVFANVGLWTLLKPSAVKIEKFQAAVAMAAVLGLVLGFGVFRVRALEHLSAAASLRVALVQASIPEGIKW